MLEEKVKSIKSVDNAFGMLKLKGALSREFNISLPSAERNKYSSRLSGFTFSSFNAINSGPLLGNLPLKGKQDVSNPTVHSIDQHDYSHSLPDSVYLQRTNEELEILRQQHWESVRDLDINHSDKILYERRFSSQMTSKPFKYYQPDIEAIKKLPAIATLEIPDNAKILIATGYHHLEKPYGKIFEKMFKEQITFDPEKVVFLNIKNNAVLTGATSIASHREIQQAIKDHDITHMIDVHEQLAMGGNYISQGISGMKTEWKKNDGAQSKAGDKWYYTLDAFIPTHHIELAPQSVICPPFQHAINQDLNAVIELAKEIEKTQQSDLGIGAPYGGSMSPADFSNFIENSR